MENEEEYYSSPIPIRKKSTSDANQQIITWMLHKLELDDDTTLDSSSESHQSRNEEQHIQVVKQTRYGPALIKFGKGEHVSVGRHASNKLVLRPRHFTHGVVCISRMHATIHVDGTNTCTILDNNSMNGTYVNGTRIRAGVPYRLANSDQITFAVLGQFTYLLTSKQTPPQISRVRTFSSSLPTKTTTRTNIIINKPSITIIADAKMMQQDPLVSYKRARVLTSSSSQSPSKQQQQRQQPIVSLTATPTDDDNTHYLDNKMKHSPILRNLNDNNCHDDDDNHSNHVIPMLASTVNDWLTKSVNLKALDNTRAVKDGNCRLESIHFSVIGNTTTNTLNREDVSQISAQYGRAECVLIEQIIEWAKITPSTRFCDLGSGIGTVCIQVAATTGCQVLGLELMPGRYDTSLELRDAFLKYASTVTGGRDNSFPERITFLNADFTTPTMINLARKCDVFWVNNSSGIFHTRSNNGNTPALDWYVALIACGTSLGSRFFCLDSISELDCNPLCQAFSKQVYVSKPFAVSWNKVPKLVYVYTKIKNEWSCPRCSFRNGLILKRETEFIQDQCLMCSEDKGGMCRSMYMLRGAAGRD